MRQTMPLLCRICPLNIKIYVYPFVLRLDTLITLQNMPSENQDLYVPFCYKTDTLQNMPSEKQDLYLLFCYETGNGFTLQNMPSEHHDICVPFS